MSKKGLKFGIASAAVIGAGAAVLRAKNKSEAKKSSGDNHCNIRTKE